MRPEFLEITAKLKKKLPPFYLRVVWALDKKIRAKSFLGRFSHMQGAIRGWNVEKLEGGGSQILQTSHLHGVP